MYRSLSRSARGLVGALLTATAASAAAIHVGLGSLIVAALAAAVFALTYPLARQLPGGISAKERYLREHRPLACPKPGARLG